MRLYVIRHGETRLNIEGRLQGWVDEPLNQSGIDLAQVTGKALEDIPFDLMITSPLIRAKRTGELVIEAVEKKQNRKIPVVEDARLKEINWGCWDGLGCTASNFELEDLDNFKLFLSGTTSLQFVPAEDGESVRMLLDRLGDFYDDLIHNPEYQDKTILLSTHGAASRALLCHFYEDESDFWRGSVPNNCAVNIVDIIDGKAHVLAQDKIYYDPELVVNMYN